MYIVIERGPKGQFSSPINDQEYPNGREYPYQAHGPYDTREEALDRAKQWGRWTTEMAVTEIKCP